MKMKMSATEGLTAIAVMLLFLAGVSFLFSWPVYMLWNHCLVDAVQGVKEVTWLQAWGLNLLFGIMFKPSTVNRKS